MKSYRSENLPLNVDFYSASVYHSLNIEHDLFTPILLSHVHRFTQSKHKKALPVNTQETPFLQSASFYPPIYDMPILLRFLAVSSVRSSE
nr:citrate/2-methylcitrate synthase [Planococcus faecalis]